jgi:hypothetical protein
MMNGNSSLLVEWEVAKSMVERPPASYFYGLLSLMIRDASGDYLFSLRLLATAGGYMRSALASLAQPGGDSDAVAYAHYI